MIGIYLPLAVVNVGMLQNEGNEWGEIISDVLLQGPSPSRQGHQAPAVCFVEDILASEVYNYSYIRMAAAAIK